MIRSALGWKIPQRTARATSHCNHRQHYTRELNGLAYTDHPVEWLCFAPWPNITPPLPPTIAKCAVNGGHSPCHWNVKCPSERNTNASLARNSRSQGQADLEMVLGAAYSSRIVAPTYSCSYPTTGTAAIAARACASCRYGPCWVG